MLGDILRDTWAYQEIMEEGREEGREEGLKQGLQEGLKEGLQEGLQALRQILLSITQTSYPELEALARVKAALITEPNVLQDVTLKMLAARNNEEARQILNAIVIKVE